MSLTHLFTIFIALLLSSLECLSELNLENGAVTSSAITFSALEAVPVENSSRNQNQ